MYSKNLVNIFTEYVHIYLRDAGNILYLFLPKSNAGEINWFKFFFLNSEIL